MENTGIIIRKAKPADHEPILDINRDVYEGTDYLSAQLHNLFHFTDVQMFVTACEGRIVQFVGIWFNGDRTEGLVFGARTHKDFQGRGLMSKAMDFVHKYILQTYTHPVHMLFTAYDNPKVNYPFGIPKDQARIHRTWRCLKYDFTATQLNKIETNTTQQVHKFSVDRTLSILGDPNTLTMLQKDGDYIIVTPLWMPVKINERNLRRLAKTSSATQFTMNEESATALSFGSEQHYKNNSLRCDLFFYGGNGDVNALVSHVVHYLANLKAVTPTIQDYIILLRYPKDIAVEDAEEKLFPMLGNTYSRDDNKYKDAIMIRDQKPVGAAVKS